MVTFKAEVYHKRKDGTYNIKIRVIHNKQKRYLATPYYAETSDLTRSLKLKNQRYIDLTEDIIRQYRIRCEQLGMSIRDMNIDDVVEYMTMQEDNKELDFFEYADRYLSQLGEENRTGTMKNYRAAVVSLKKFLGRDKLSFKEITSRLLEDWVRHIENVSGRYAAHEYPRFLKTIFRKAKFEYNDEDAGNILIPNSPFSHFVMPTAPLPRKRAISIEILKKLISIPYKTTTKVRYYNSFNFAKDMFILSFALIGMNTVDFYNCTDYRNGRITYKRTKTRTRRKDEALISIRVEPEIKELIDKYRDKSGERVFCFYKHFSSTICMATSINQGLKEIGRMIGEPNLQFYAARHTWATLAVNDVSIDKYRVHACLNHVDPSTSMTDVYVKKSWKPIDEANRKVLDYVNIGKLNLVEPR